MLTVGLVVVVVGLTAVVVGWVAWLRKRRRAARRLGLALVHELERVDSVSAGLELSLELFERAAALRRLLHDRPHESTTAEVLQWAAETAARLDHATAGVVRVADGDDAPLVAAHGMPLEHALAQSIVWPHPAPRGVSFAFDYGGDGTAPALLRSGLAVPLRHESHGEEFIAVFSQADHAPAEELIDALEALAVQVAEAIGDRDDGLGENDVSAPPLDARRRTFLRVLAREVYLARRDSTTLVLLLIDIDDFGAVNRRFGPQQADRILAEVAALTRDAAQNAMSYRVGGDAFAITAPGSGVTDAERMLASLRASLLATGVTVSAGIAELDPDDDWLSMLVRADGALRHAKAAGRDTASVARTRSSIPSRPASDIGRR